MIYWTHERTHERVPRCAALRRYASRGSTLQFGAKLSLLGGKIITFGGKVSLGARLFATHYEGGGGGDDDGGASGGDGGGYNNDGKGTDQSSSSRVSRDILRNVSSAMFDE